MIHKTCLPFVVSFIILAATAAGQEIPRQIPDIPDTILVKGDWYYPPYEFLDENGVPNGFNVELFQAIARDFGLTYRLELGPWSLVREELVNGEIHVILGLMVSPQRAELMDFGIPHSVMTQGIFTRKGDRLNSLEDLAGKEVIVQQSDLMHEYLLEAGLTDKIIAVPGQLEALTLLNEGQHDAAIIGNYQGSHLIANHNLKNISLQTSNIDPKNYGMAVRKGDAELLALLNSGLYHLKASGEYDELYKKWFAVYQQRHVWERYRLYIIGIAAFAGLLALFVILLRLQVAKARRRLRESESRYSNVFENSHAVLMLVDPESGRIVDANQAASNFYGWSQEELRNKSISEINILSAEEIRVEMEKAAMAGKSQVELQHRLASGKVRHVEVFSGTVRFGEKDLLFSIVHDVTDRKLAEASNKELEAFAYSVSHDLRAPLRAIDGFSRILLEDYSGQLDAEGKRACDVISENARKMSQLINDLLTFSRLTRSEIQDLQIDMGRMVDSVYHELAGEEKRKQVRLVVDPLPMIKGDPAMMRHVWSNLIENALKFTGNKESPEIHIRASREKKRIIFLVEDNGVGFDMQYSEKLFQVFQRLHSPKEFQGSGVGLAIVQRVVERHGGRVWAKGEPGLGASFYFSLPE
jgi:PAS domain S-box-containing protein